MKRSAEGKATWESVQCGKRLAYSGVPSIGNTAKFPKQVRGLKKQANKTKLTNKKTQIHVNVSKITTIKMGKHI